jgi:TRAP transporter TAXI family solute receptor
MRKTLILSVTFFVAAMTFIASFNLAEAQKKKFISIGTGGTGGTFYIVGAGIAKVINKYAPGMKATSEATGAVIENCKLVGTKKLTLAFNTPGESYWAYKGEKMFKERYEGLRWVMGGHSQVQHILARADSPIKSIEDLRGKRVGVGAPGSGTAGTAIATLEANGLKQGVDYKPEWLSFVEVVEGLKDGTIDAGFITLGLPGSAVIDLTTSRAIRFLPLSKEVQHKLEPLFFFPGIIKKGTYKGLNEDVPSVTNLVNLITHKDVDTETIYAITKVIHEHTRDLAEVHPAGNEYSLENALRGLTIPLHPGAEKYYKEKGVK